MNGNQALESATALAADVNQVPIELQCPACGFDLGGAVEDPAACSGCGFTMTKTGGIYRALPSNRALYFDRFLEEYQSIRQKEGRLGSSEYYLGLPFRDATGNNSGQWKIRARTFLYFEKNILPKIVAQNPQGADILDMGAGNGWFSYRLALKRQRPVALDLADNGFDGLGAARHYFFPPIHPFPCFQAEMDHLPFRNRQFDAVVFNASFHYSTDYEATLKEAVRCLRRPGYLVIADSPFYRRAESGERMLAERKRNFRRKFGMASDSLPSKEYLTAEILSELARRLSLKWNLAKPWYGFAWALRPVKARILGRREPSKFYLLWSRIEP
jgi:ubiquinone/menaquinone biosynthesis C-methylase UbiE